MEDDYRIIAEQVRAAIKIKGSRFIAEAIPVEETKEVESQIETIRSRERQATHHCMAYRLGEEGKVYRYNDDGEPSGTAGRPILRQIDARQLTNTLVVVTRYFGGTELGTGGLMRAYGDAASAVLERTPIVERVVRVPVRLRFSYEDTSPAQQVLHQFDTTVEEQTYTDVTELTARVRRSEVNAFLDAFTEALSGRGEVLWVGEDREAPRS